MTDDHGDDRAMTPERWATIEDIYTRALQVPAEQRPRFLDDACASDAALRAEIESLLAEHDRDPDYLELSPAWLSGGEEDASTATPERIGPYRVVGKVGRGGMGTVYLAEQEEPGFHRRVAVKVVRRGVDTEDVLARFRAERVILAALDHPNIARFLDVGTTDSGQPFLVMEYVEGTPLLAYCDANQLSVAARLTLFRGICAAVHHAHRSLIVHRDIKPSNIRVTPDGVAKLLDFGIAKVLDPSQQGLDVPLTRTEVRLLTPEYAAPEQLRGEPITTACDVHALGLLLYELLTGCNPFAVIEREQRERAILEQDPRPPSLAIDEQVAVARDTTVVQLRRRLTGDLDTIVLKALRKDPADRYASALSLAEDLERHENGLPVLARPITVRYRMRKFVARNRGPVGAIVTLVLVLAASAVMAMTQANRIRLQSERVTRERDKALEVRSFLLEMFSATGPDQATGDTVTARQLLDRRAATLAAAYADDAEVRSEMMYVLAEGYEKLGILDSAEPLAKEALALRRELFGDRHGDVVASLNQVGWLLRERQSLEEAETVLREAIAVGRSVFGQEGDVRLARAINDLGVVRYSRGDYAESAGLYREALDMRRRLQGQEHVGVGVTMSNLALAAAQNGDRDEATRLAGAAHDLFLRVLGPDHQRTIVAATNLAAFLSSGGDHVGAARIYRDLVERRSRLFGERHATVGQSLAFLANELRAFREYGEAERLLERSIEIQTEAYGRLHGFTASTIRVLGDVKRESGRPAAALAEYRAALDIQRRLIGNVGTEVLVLLERIALAHEDLGEATAAERALREAVGVATRTYGAEASRTLGVKVSVLELLVRVGRQVEARELLRELDDNPRVRDDARLAGRVDTARAGLAGTDR